MSLFRNHDVIVSTSELVIGFIVIYGSAFLLSINPCCIFYFIDPLMEGNTMFYWSFQELLILRTYSHVDV